MLNPKIVALLQEVEKLSQEQQESIAEALAVEIADVTTPQPTLQELMAEARDDIAHGRTTALDAWLDEDGDA
jgi:hypothetical protein